MATKIMVISYDSPSGVEQPDGSIIWTGVALNLAAVVPLTLTQSAFYPGPFNQVDANGNYLANQSTVQLIYNDVNEAAIIAAITGLSNLSYYSYSATYVAPI